MTEYWMCFSGARNRFSIPPPAAMKSLDIGGYR